jgi:hypothetical protein
MWCHVVSYKFTVVTVECNASLLPSSTQQAESLSGCLLRLLYAGFLLSLLFDPEDGGHMFL